MRYTIKQKEGEIMELRVLRYFLAVAREENITAAAESLHVTQPTLSKQLMDLEAQLGKTLFLRGKRKVSALLKNTGTVISMQVRYDLHILSLG